MKRSRWRIGCIIIVVLLLGSGYYLHRVDQSIRNSYAVWWVASMVVEHLKANDNQWPKNWDDLRDDYETCTERSGRPWSFEELSSRAEIDWGGDPAELLAQSKESETVRFRVIKLTDGTDAHWQRREPNQIILDYLRSNASEKQP